MEQCRWVIGSSLLLCAWTAFAGCGGDDDPSFKTGQGQGGTDASTGGSGGVAGTQVVGGTGASAGAGLGGVGTDGGPCSAGRQICGQFCIDPEVDQANCGSCGHACAGNEACESGVCVTSCLPGQIVCADACFDPQIDNANCGSCGTTCDGGSSCEAGLCVCPGSQLLCGGACVDPSSDGLNCGGCGVSCVGGQSCTNGACLCSPGEESCAGQCTNTDSDPANCGSCGSVCSSPSVCSSGACVLSCGGGTTKCGGACVNLQTDPNNCGSCGIACPSAQSCLSGSCACPNNGTLCSGQCVDIQTNGSHCGGCGNTCSGGQSCVNGTCGCTGGQLPCNGQCANPGSWCSDNDACTQNDTCQAFGCAGTPVSCADANPCTVDSCSPSVGCLHAPAPIGSACDDGNSCTVGETCQAGSVCQGQCPTVMLFASDATVFLSGIQFTPQDVIAFDHSSNTFSMYFDGSDVGVSEPIDGIEALSNGDLLLSIRYGGSIPGVIGGPGGNIGSVDILRFTPTSLGATTAGTFYFEFDGSDLGLTVNLNNVDAIGRLPNGDLLMSVAYDGTVFMGNTSVTADAEDVVRFVPISLGATTAGHWYMYFNHSGTTPPWTQNVDGIHYRASDGALLLSHSYPNSPFPGANAEDEDVYAFSTSFLFSEVFNGSAHGLTADLNDLSYAAWKPGCVCQ